MDDRMRDTSDSAGTVLDEMVCFALYSASNAVAQAHRSALEPWGLTYTQYIALVELSAVPAAGLAVGELGRRLGLDSGTLSPLLRRLEQRGFVSRERRSRDERVVTVALTFAGLTARAELAEAIGCLTPQYGIESADQLHDLIAALGRITTGMRAFTAPGAPGPAVDGPAAPGLATAAPAAPGPAAPPRATPPRVP